MEELKPIEAGKIKCSRCGLEATERVCGTGFPGWCRLSEVTGVAKVERMVMVGLEMKKVVENVQVFPELCPSCMRELVAWVMANPKDNIINIGKNN